MLAVGKAVLVSDAVWWVCQYHGCKAVRDLPHEVHAVHEIDLIAQIRLSQMRCDDSRSHDEAPPLPLHGHGLPLAGNREPVDLGNIVAQPTGHSRYIRTGGYAPV